MQRKPLLPVDMKNITHNLKNGEIFIEISRKVDNLIMMLVFVALKVMEKSYKSTI